MTRVTRAVWTIGLSLLVVSFFVTSFHAHAQSANLRGVITAADDGESLQGVHISLRNDQGELYGAVSDNDGLFVISRLPAGRYLLSASFVGFATFTDTLTLAPQDRQVYEIVMYEDESELDELIIEAERESGAARVTAGMERVTPEQITAIPSPDISGDLVSYLSTLPGVVLMGDRGGQIFIRGGEPSHNMTLIDGMQIYQPFHVLGFYSAFPADIVSGADVYAGGFGSKFTGRVSSVIDVQTRDGNKRMFRSSATLSPFTSSATLEGPLLRDRLSFLGSGRISMLDELASRYVTAPLPYRFGDVFGKVHARLSASHQLSLSGLNTFDRGRIPRQNELLGENEEIRWSNAAYGMRYLIAPRTIPIIGEVLVSYSRLDSDLGPAGDPVRSSRIESINTAFNVTNYLGDTQWDWGGFLRESTIDSELGGLFQNVLSAPERSVHAGGYIEPEVRLRGGWSARAGISAQVYGTSGVYVEPRFRLLWDRGRHHWSLAAGLYRQDIVGLNDRRDATNIFTAWVETPLGEATRAAHALLGYRTTPATWLELSVEGYFKKLDDLFVSAWTPFPTFTTSLQHAEGHSAGFDFRIEWRRSHFYGFVNYGYSATMYEANSSHTASYSGSYRPPHDRRHQINILATGAVRDFNVSLRWQFGSGLPYSRIHGFDGFILMDGAVEVDRVRGFPRVIYEAEPYRGILPTYHRLDITVDRTFTFKSGLEATLQLGLLNAYNRRNLFALDLFTAQRTDQLPLIPTAGIRLDI